MTAGVIQILEEGPRNYIIKVTGDTATATQLIVDVSGMAPPASTVRLMRATVDILAGVAVELLWDASSPLRMYKFNAFPVTPKFERFGGLWNNAGAGKTGDVLMTVTGTGSYTVVLEFVKSNVVIPI